MVHCYEDSATAVMVKQSLRTFARYRPIPSLKFVPLTFVVYASTKPIATTEHAGWFRGSGTPSYVQRTLGPPTRKAW